MKSVYIASSWKNQHAVELLTEKFEEMGFVVFSWVRNNFGETHNHVTKKLEFEEWVNSDESGQSFEYDSSSAIECDIFIYLSPAGKDAAAECGMAYAANETDTYPKKIYALWSKGEDFGLMRKMFSRIFTRYTDLLDALEFELQEPRFPQSKKQNNS